MKKRGSNARSHVVNFQSRGYRLESAMLITARTLCGRCSSTIRCSKRQAQRRDHAGHEHLVRPAEADRCRSAECWIRRSWPRRWSCGHSSARLALRHLQLRRCRSVAGLGGLPGDRPLSAWLRHYALSFDETFRNGQPSAVALDIIALMDALKIEKAILAGFDWGGRTADIIAALWPERCKALVSVSGYLIGSPEANKMPLPPKAELQWWYQFYFATERGRAGYDKYRRDFAKLIWQIASPKWNFDDATFDRTRRILRQSGSRRHRDP